MRPPNPIFLLKAGIRNMTDSAVLWHLALCGLTGSGMQEIADATGLSYNTVAHTLIRLEEMKLTIEQRLRDKPGHPLVITLSRMGFRLMAGHLTAEEKAAQGGQLPMGDEVVKTS